MSYKISKRFKRLLFSILLISSISFASYLLGWSSLLTVEEVEIKGTESTSVILNELKSKDVEPVVGQKLARVEIRSVKRVLSDLDWIASAQASRNWLSKKIEIQVVERVAVAKALTESNSMVNFDSDGSIFNPTSNKQLKGQELLPLVSTAGDSRKDLVDVALLLKQIPAELSYLVSDLDQISVTKAGYILMSTRINSQAVRINWGSIDQIDQKFSVLQALLKLPENKGIKQVDLSEPKAPIVK
ncbi:cell division protein FtsQ [Candidatus Nanopelagicus limnes]|uniref:Cell division protein FtsQ n=1 Tax=Candidatus Nanopelagicus limnae TaxID=1884634 RepID=A0A249JY65_9ACTN|nr:cell division protein FtsQ/DivIB [Candidatus Nanopelagicus limnes]ASY09460.1 cell division protein FtsQ [Candidatus Nanopelagicus limnes]